MNALIILAVALAAVLADEQIIKVTQDTLGNYDLKYAIKDISRAEHRDADGLVSGGYSFVDPDGVLRKTTFTAGAHGFHAEGTDIPLPVADTPEVALAKNEHITLLRAAEAAAPAPEIPVAVAVPAVAAAPEITVSVAAPAVALELPLAPVAKAAVPVEIVPVAVVAARATPVSPDVLDVEGRLYAGKKLIH